MQSPSVFSFAFTYAKSARGYAQFFLEYRGEGDVGCESAYLTDMINRIICVQQLIACNRQSVLQKILIRTCADGFPKLFAQLFLIDMELFQKVGGVDGGIAVAVPNNVQGLFDLRIIFGDVQRFRVFCMRFLESEIAFSHRCRQSINFARARHKLSGCSSVNKAAQSLSRDCALHTAF